MRPTLIKFLRKAHRLILWLALLAAGVFFLSAICHPLMVWTGPQPVKRMPPALTINTQQLNQIQEQMSLIELQGVSIAQITPTENGAALQVTQQPSEPRLYFTGSSEAMNDRKQAIWLARYYTGIDSPITSVTFIDNFSNDYPAVNRLLPVYKVTFDTKEALTAFVHTETNALAGLTNNWKQLLKTLFQRLHTLNWLDNLPITRLIIMSILLALLSFMAISGVYLLLSLKRKTYKNRQQRFHRSLAWMCVVPLLGFLISGFYHLYQQALSPSADSHRVFQAMDLSHFQSIALPKDLQAQSMNALSLLTLNGQPAFRASLAQPTLKKISKEKHFNGLPKETSAVYYSTDGKILPLTDKDYADQLLHQALGANNVIVINQKKISRFGNGYDFRNNRLPVWRFDLDSGDTIFIDPRKALLVEHITPSQKLEGRVFSLLHKWNFLKGVFGRFGRDALLAVMMLLLISLAFFGQRLSKT
ncbi:MAG: PepSY domain-containing protein [Cellvibrionales bacterium]|nr:PepSY domain-containing protein [Cellvibrionales bacterium]